MWAAGIYKRTQYEALRFSCLNICHTMETLPTVFKSGCSGAYGLTNEHTVLPPTKSVVWDRWSGSAPRGTRYAYDGERLMQSWCDHASVTKVVLHMCCWVVVLAVRASMQACLGERVSSRRQTRWLTSRRLRSIACVLFSFSDSPPVSAFIYSAVHARVPRNTQSSMSPWLTVSGCLRVFLSIL